MFPQHAEIFGVREHGSGSTPATASASANAAGMHVSTERAEKLARLGAATSRVGKVGGTPELKALADDLYEHENSMKDWFKSELDRSSDGQEGICIPQASRVSRAQAVTPRTLKDLGGDRQQLVLAAFASKDAAEQAAHSLKQEREQGRGRRASKGQERQGTGTQARRRAPAQAAAEGPEITDEDRARIGRELDAGRAAVGVLTWDFETEAVAKNLKDPGGTPKLMKWLR